MAEELGSIWAEVRLNYSKYDEGVAHVVRQNKWLDEEMQRTVEQIRNVKPGETIMGAPAAYWLDLKGYRPAEEARNLPMPLLVLQGERDYQVTMEDFAGWKRALEGKATLTPEQVCVVDLDGVLVETGEGGARPSTEVPMHTLIYRHSDAVAIVHAHPLHATALGALVDETPALHYILASFGGPVRVAPYARFGTDELAENVRVAMDGRSAVLLRNHGLTCWAPTLAKAYDKALQLEWACQVALLAMASGRPALLTADQVDEVAREMRRTGYGA